MKRFIMPGGRYSGRRYGVVNKDEYQEIIEHAKDNPLQLAWVIEGLSLIIPDTMRDLVNLITDFATNMRKIDTLTLVVYKPVLFNWLEPLGIAGYVSHTTIVTDGTFGLDAPGIPTTDILLYVDGATSMTYVVKFGNRPNVLYGVLVPMDRIHWALGALKHSGRPDINLYVDLLSLSPIGGASV